MNQLTVLANELATTKDLTVLDWSYIIGCLQALKLAFDRGAFDRKEAVTVLQIITALELAYEKHTSTNIGEIK